MNILKNVPLRCLRVLFVADVPALAFPAVAGKAAVEGKQVLSLFEGGPILVEGRPGQKEKGRDDQEDLDGDEFEFSPGTHLLLLSLDLAAVSAPL